MLALIQQFTSASIFSFILINNITTAVAIQPPALAESNFYDLQGNWAKSCITYLAKQGIISGYPDGSFRPNLSVNRAEFAAIVVKTFPKAARIRQPIAFVDVPVYHWAYKPIVGAAQTSFLSGYPGQLFQPDQKISRSQVLVSLASGLNYSSPKQATTILQSNFSDAKTIPVYAQSKIAAATTKGLVVNYPNVKFLNPNKRASRAEVAAFLCQALVSSGEASRVPQQYIVGGASKLQDYKTLAKQHLP